MAFEVGAFITGLATSILAAGAIYQARRVIGEYKRNEHWRRSELASRELERFDSDDVVLFCCTALDWSTGPLLIPKIYQPLFPDSKGVLWHDWKELETGLRADFNQPLLSPAILYRYCFDRFFGFLTRLYDLVAADHLSADDLSTVKYWVKQIIYPDNAPDGMNKPDVFGKFLNKYQYLKVFRLADRLGVTIDANYASTDSA